MITRRQRKGYALIALLAMLLSLMMVGPVSAATGSGGSGVGIGSGADYKLVFQGVYDEDLPTAITAGATVDFVIAAVYGEDNTLVAEQVKLEVTQSPALDDVNKYVYSGNELVINAGENCSQAVSFTAQKAQEYTLTVTDKSGKFAPAVYKITVKPGAFTKVDMKGYEAVEVNLRNKIDLQLQDQFGNPVNNQQGAYVYLNTVNSYGNYEYGEFYDALIGGDGISYVYFAPGQNSATIYFRSTQVGSYTIESSNNWWYWYYDRYIYGSKTVKVTEAKLIRVDVTNESIYGVTAGNRGKLAISQTDMYGNVIVPTSDVMIDLSTTSEKGQFYATGNTDDNTPITQVKLTAGQVAASVYYYDEQAGAPVVTASVPGLESDSQELYVYPSVATDIELEDYSDHYVATYGYMGIRIVDKFGNNTWNNTPLTVDLSSTGDGKFYDYIYDDYSGSKFREISQKTIPGYNWCDYSVYNSVSFLYKNDTIGEYEITTTTTGLSKTIKVNVVEEPTYEYYDRVLYAGWNTLSIPVVLEDQSLNTLFGDDSANIEAVYAYNSKQGKFEKITDFTTEISVLDAILVKVMEGKTVTAKFYDKVATVQTAPPSKNLDAGWNFVGPAIWNEGNYLDANTNFESIEGKYSQIISPGYHQDSWIYTSDMDYGMAWVEDGYGYWVFMKEAGTLAGFSYTPDVYDDYEKDVLE